MAAKNKRHEYPGKRPQIVWGSGGRMYDHVDDDDDDDDEVQEYGK